MKLFWRCRMVQNRKTKRILPFLDTNGKVQSIRDVRMYHGTAAKYRFSQFLDYKPAFFTSSLTLAQNYGKGEGKARVLECSLTIERPFDPSQSALSQQVYNQEFVPFFSSKYARLSDGLRPLVFPEPLSFVWADYLWSFLRKRAREDAATDFDGMVVSEGVSWENPEWRWSYSPLYIDRQVQILSTLTS